MSVCLNHCLKRFPLVPFSRYYASAAVARTTKAVASDTDPVSEDGEVKKRAPRKPKESTPPKEPKPRKLLEPPSRPSILERTKVQDHLDSLAKSNGQLDLLDIERCRPQHSPAAGTPQYEKEYNELFLKITGAFTVKQLRHFLELYGMPVSSRYKKDECARAIIEGQWGWRSLDSIKEELESKQTSVETFPLTPTQAFLILGKDGVDSRSLSAQYHVRMKYLPNMPKPVEDAQGNNLQQDPEWEPQRESHSLTLQVEGMVGSLKNLAKHVMGLKAAITQEVFELPMDRPIGDDVLHSISRLSGALTEKFGEGQIRVTYNGNTPRTAIIAKRLAARAACESSDAKHTRLFFHLPPSVPSSSPLPESEAFPNSYSLYPFLSPRSLPWTVGTSGVFRLRRVEEWLGTGASENLTKTGGLLMKRGRMVSLQQHDVDLWALLQARPPESAASSRVVTASIGHILLTSPLGGQISIVPPLQGHWKLPQIMEWIQQRSEPKVFNPTLPAALLDSRPTQDRMLHRLVYQAANHAIYAGDDVSPHKFIKLEVLLSRSIEEISDVDFAEQYHPSCWLGLKSDVDVMMPDRPTDIRFSISDSDILPAHLLPPQLTEYMSDLRAYLSYQNRGTLQPPPPLTVVHDGVTYLLYSSSTVQQNIERTEAGSPVKVVTESSLDLEGDQKSELCQVICDDIVSEVHWQSFLQQCDAISSTPTTKRTPHSLDLS